MPNIIRGYSYPAAMTDKQKFKNAVCVTVIAS